ncbi:hypothetical protein CPB85DRAFT_1249736 [Mucidula mucida]|nr:hypothetical protein CPB85DRAFT_1249736 [Mucidula mucida]
MFSLNVALIAAVLSVANVVSADAPATCSAHGFDLTSDGGKSPCYIASLMVGGGYMPEDSPYPRLSGQTDLLHLGIWMLCVPVISSNTWPTWDSWTTNCGNITGVKYIAETMPYDTALPNWVFTDPVVTGGTFNYTAAKLVGASEIDEIPETTFNVNGDSTGSSTAATCSNKAGAIAGAAVGSAVGGALIGALIMFLLGKKSKKLSADRGSIHSHESEDTIAREKKIANRA